MRCEEAYAYTIVMRRGKQRTADLPRHSTHRHPPSVVPPDISHSLHPPDLLRTAPVRTCLMFKLQCKDEKAISKRHNTRTIRRNPPLIINQTEKYHDEKSRPM